MRVSSSAYTLADVFRMCGVTRSVRTQHNTLITVVCGLWQNCVWASHSHTPGTVSGFCQECTFTTHVTANRRQHNRNASREDCASCGRAPRSRERGPLPLSLGARASYPRRRGRHAHRRESRRDGSVRRAAHGRAPTLPSSTPAASPHNSSKTSATGPPFPCTHTLSARRDTAHGARARRGVPLRPGGRERAGAAPHVQGRAGGSPRAPVRDPAQPILRGRRRCGLAPAPAAGLTVTRPRRARCSGCPCTSG